MRFCIVLTLLFLLVGATAYEGMAGTNGNLKGKVSDVTSGEPLPGVNILIVGSGRGGVTNDKGEFFITGVPVGSYILRVSSLGYQTIESKKVEIDADETAVLNFKLAGEDILMEGVTTIGQAPLVDVSKTAGTQSFSRDKIEQLPNVKGVEDVIGLQAGIVKHGGQLFLRGGRANETQILIDGVAVNDIGGGTSGNAANEQLRGLYSGSSTAGAGGALSVSANAIQSVSVSSSGLDAEYGNAQSGIVNITTKTGGDSYSGSAQYRTDSPTSQSFDEQYYAGNFGGPEPITTYLLPSLGITIPGRISLFVSGSFNQSDEAFSFTKARFYNPTRRKIRFGGFLDGLLNGLGFTYSDKQVNEFTFNSKLAYQIGETDNLTYSYKANAESRHPLIGNQEFRDRYDSTRSSVSFSAQNVLQWTHIIGMNSLLKGFVSYLEKSRTSSVGDLAPTQYSVVGSDLDPSGDGFYDLGSVQNWSTEKTSILNAKFDFSAKVHDLHFLKVGVDYFYEEINSASISEPAKTPSDSIAVVASLRGPYPGVGDRRLITSAYPSRGALYAQDNIEFPSINIKIGLRYDFFYLGKQVFSNEWVSRWEYVTGEKATWLENSTFMKAFTKGYFSPRLAIGYPISEKTVFYFNYGHFLQYPERDEIYHDPLVTTSSSNSVGNPSLKPQKTVQYEAGFDQLIFEDLSLGIRGFYKDIFDYVALNVRANPDKNVNLDYASSRGFELIVTKQLRNRYSGSVGYTFSLAKGRAANKFAAQENSALFSLPREVRLEFDQQHTLNVFMAYRVGPREDFSILGIPFDNWGASFTWSYGSGTPYTPFDPTVVSGSLGELYNVNTGTTPFTSEVNFNLYKGFSILDKLNLTATLDIVNLFNRRNVAYNSSTSGGFNTALGRPIVFGDYSNDTRVTYNWQSFAARVPAFIFRPPRQIAFGVRINWD